MNMTRICILIAVLLLGVAPVAGAREKPPATPGVGSGAAAAARWTVGEVRRVDKTAGTVTIKHGPMPKLGMPAMIMPYRIKDKAMLERLKPDDKIKFDADAAGGEFTVTRLEQLK